MIDAGFARLNEREDMVFGEDELLDLAPEELAALKAMSASSVHVDVQWCEELGPSGVRFRIRMRRRVPCITSLGAE